MTDLDGHGRATGVDLDIQGQPSGHGMEEVSCTIRTDIVTSMKSRTPDRPLLSLLGSRAKSEYCIRCQ
jgi:hypothetical protein